MTDYITAPPLIKDFLSYISNIQDKSKLTVSEYHLDLIIFYKFILFTNNSMTISDIEKNPELWENLNVSDVTIDDLKKVDKMFIYNYLAFLSDHRGLTARSRNRKLSSLRSYFKYLVNSISYITVNPTLNLDSPKIKTHLPSYLSLEESMNLLNEVDKNGNVRDYAIITLFLNCGMRVSELVSIDIKDIQENRITIMGKGKKERIVYLNNACIEAINSYLKVRPVDGVKDKNALFISRNKKRISIKTVQWLVKKYIGNSGLNEKKYSVHKLRHTAATLMYQYGGDIMAVKEILGHEDLSTTQIYTHLNDKKLQEIIDLNPLNKILKG